MQDGANRCQLNLSQSHLNWRVTTTGKAKNLSAHECQAQHTANCLRSWGFCTGKQTWYVPNRKRDSKWNLPIAGCCLTAKCYLITRITSPFLEKGLGLGCRMPTCTSKWGCQLGDTQGQGQSVVCRATAAGHLGTWMASWSYWCLLGHSPFVPRMLLCHPLPVSPWQKERALLTQHFLSHKPC